MSSENDRSIDETVHENFKGVREKIHFVGQEFNKVKKDPSILGSVIKELWITFKKPLLYVFLAFIAFLIIIPPATYLYFIRDLSSKESILNRKNAGVILTDRNDKPFFTFYKATNKKVIPLSDIPEFAQKAVVAVEDRQFYSHSGFSLQGIGRALLSDIKEEELAQGGSTITQQLVKNTLLSQEKNLLRKYQELFLAIEVERRFSKDDILEMYLNTVYFGEGAFGIEDASQTYFSKDAEKLTLGEAALLAAILPAPSAYSPLSGNKEKAYERQKIVLSQMKKQGFISDVEEKKALSQTITFNPKPPQINQSAPHFALMVKEELIEKYGEQKVANSGFRIKTTLDLLAQEYAEQVVETQVQRLARNKVTNAAAVAIHPKNGEILALVGSHDWFDEDNGKINMVLRPRQPGSSFKPIVYALAFRRELITPATILEDKPVTFPDGYKPVNYDHKFRDKIIARLALANSLNIPAVHIMEKTGVGDTLEFAKDLGITTLKNSVDYGLSLVLGSGEVPLIQMVQAYGTFANKGDLVKATTILQVLDKNNNPIYTYQPTASHALSAAVSYQISSILSDNQARMEVFGNALTISRPAAVKTGTTNDYKDALTIGYTPSLVVGVWVGNNDNTPMDSIAGSLGAAPIWRQIMEFILKGTKVEQFVKPAELREVKVCKENGLKADIATTSAYPEYFLPGTAPTKSCTENLTPTPTQTPAPEPTNTPTPQPIIPTETPTPTPTPTPLIPTPTPTDLPIPTI